MTTIKIARICSVENCNALAFARQMCKPHYMVAWKKGLPPLAKPVRLCSVDDCHNKHSVRGLCKKHSYRQELYGSPTTLHLSTGQGETHIERFWSRVNKEQGQGPNGDCWEWTAKSKDNHGYGGLQVDGKRWKAHQFAYYLATGVIPRLHILHSCDNPPCCNPSHLREGTPADNATDKVQRGRTPRGEQVWNTTLTENDVRYIRKQCSNGVMHKILAQELGIAKSTISAIVTKRTWRYVKDNA